ncbi:cytochrome P450 CYP5080B3 [Bimuria novae-zelandiae CBS 107.79]|uniref:Cytochrome P450 CYP5080B3 n=1 Tax=Bimuria novae-zelandiae CBS 107.79 TaxID=1447943 RepID=A0A6A5V763_9PLEO|nr:cytochrome P450 CYP5080B3 [Bimuria novae-zelandiae CBS 107.79]
MHLGFIIYAALAAVVFRALYIFVSSLFSPLRSIPGPLLARFTKAWYFHSIYKAHHQDNAIALHRKYAKPGEHFAPIVRLGPNMYSIKSPDKVVYGISSKMPKNAWYEGWKHPSPERWTLFTDRNIKRHAESRRVYASLYTQTALLSYESYADECADMFALRLRELAQKGELVDMGHWFQCYAFDVISAITYGKRFGFLDEGRDLGNTIRALDRAMAYSTLVGVYSFLHPYLYPILEKFPSTGAAGRAYLMRFASSALSSRRSERANREKNGEAKAVRKEGEPEDFVDKMLDMQESKPGVTDYHVFALTMSNIVAGADTTALSLASVLYHLIRTPRALRKLREEIARHVEEGKCTPNRVSFKASQEMPYLQACIKEGLRLHPGTGLPLWRVVNDGGAEICGQYFPADSKVGVNTWVAHYDEDVWGLDATRFRPERWIETTPERLKTMEAHHIPFGTGSRTCIGRHIGHLEMSKLLPQLVHAFHFALEKPNQKWKTSNMWFVKPVDFNVRISVRITTM